MRAIADWLIGRRYRAVILAVALGFAPPLVILSAAVVSLVSLQRGAAEGAMLVASGLALWLGLAFFGGNSLAAAANTAGLVWLPALGFGVLLGRSGSLALCMQLLSLLGCAAVALIYIRLGDPATHWREVIASLQPQLDAAGLSLGTDAQLAFIAQLLTGMRVAGFMLVITLALLLGRYAQSLLVAPGRFGEEYRALRLGRVLAVLAAAVFVASGFPGVGVFDNMAVVLMVAFVFQGLAVIHGVARAQNLHAAWLVLLYGALLVVSLYAALLVALLGYLDNWFSFRARQPQG